MDVADPVWTGVEEVFGAVFKGIATPVFDGGVALLEHGAHSAIENQNPVLESFLERLAAFNAAECHLVDHFSKIY
jgi:hypothetical protein